MNKYRHQNKFALLQHDSRNQKLRFHGDISRSIPIGVPILAFAGIVLHTIALKTNIEQLKTTVSLENIAGNISCEGDMERRHLLVWILLFGDCNL